mgnify:CR=1 FL=1
MLFRSVPEFVRACEVSASKVIRAFTFRVVERMKVSFAQAKSGRVYRVSRTGRPHQASAPGEAPAILTGFLSNSILTAFPGPRVGEITIGAQYAPYLEQGTRTIAPRPYIRPAIKGTLDEFAKPGVIGGLL